MSAREINVVTNLLLARLQSSLDVRRGTKIELLHELLALFFKDIKGSQIGAYGGRRQDPLVTRTNHTRNDFVYSPKEAMEETLCSQILTEPKEKCIHGQ